MLNLKKEAKVIEVGELKVANCPICNSYISHVYFMQDATTKKQSKWFSCSCGVIHQEKYPDAVYDEKYWNKYDQFEKKLKDAYEYPVRIYAPLIEELVYGRKVLIIGRTTNHQEEIFKKRGWVPYVIDKNTHFKESKRLFVGDFEFYNFKEDLKFTLIWIYQTLECFINPENSLMKCKDLLTEDGILFIGTPDTDFINTRSSSGFIHWKPDTNYLMWNRRSLTNYLEKLGFNVILTRQNYEHRFPAWDDLHLIAQKKFF